MRHRRVDGGEGRGVESQLTSCQRAAHPNTDTIPSAAARHARQSLPISPSTWGRGCGHMTVAARPAAADRGVQTRQRRAGRIPGDLPAAPGLPGILHGLPPWAPRGLWTVAASTSADVAAECWPPLVGARGPAPARSAANLGGPDRAWRLPHRTRTAPHGRRR